VSTARPVRRHRVLLAGLLLAGVTGAAVTTASAASLPTGSEKLVAYRALSIVPVTSCVLGAQADSYVSEFELSTNHGTATSLTVRSESLGNRRSLLQFDVASCAIPSGALIRSATVRLVVTTAPAESRTYAVHRVTGSWTETGVTWSNQPSVASSATASASTGTIAGAVVQWSVEPDVDAFVQGTAVNNGWRVSDASEGALTSVQTAFAARENGTTSIRPSLSITYYP
jgi:hypothetical protein